MDKTDVLMELSAAGRDDLSQWVNDNLHVVAMGDLCAICGRPPHMSDDPECVSENAPLAEKVRFLITENGRLRQQALDAYVEVRYVLAGLSGVALRVAPNDEHMDDVIGRLAKLETALTPNAT